MLFDWHMAAILLAAIAAAGGAWLAAYRRARRQLALLQSALDALAEGFVLYDQEAGFVIFDADDRLVLCNQRYKELYSGNADLIAPGVRFEDILRRSLANREIPAAIGNEEAWLATRLRLHRQGLVTIEERRADGRW